MNKPEWVAIERTFSAPIETVWSMWAEGDNFAKWYGPPGASIPTAQMDTTVGGTRLICMQMTTPDGDMQMWFTGTFLEVSAPSRIAYTDLMCDADGTPTPPEAMGMPEGHDMTTTVEVNLEEVDGGTKMTMTHVGVPAASPGGQGWAMAIDKLDALF